MTFELRWFCPGPVGPEALERFAAGPIERRRDLYLLGTGPALGIKRRGEVQPEQKQRLAQFEVELELRDRRLACVIERWRKTGSVSAGASGTWAGVHKQRARRELGGCLAELTDLRLELPGREPAAFGTLAVETIGEPARAIAAIVAAGGRLLDGDEQLRARYLDAPCMGYPAWLEAYWNSMSPA